MRVVAISDLHCGHGVGLTPPGYQSPPAFKEARAVQREMWNWYEKKLDELYPIDALLVLGDCIDGKGTRSGATEQITTDWMEQSNMAAACIRQAKARSIVLIHGTPYHVGPDGEDYERYIAREVEADVVGGHEWADAHGVIFDLKHKVGASRIPHGRHTAIARERLWNILWHEREGAPKANIILRGHVHYFNYCGGADWLAMTMPALQGPGSKYGVRQCSGTVHFGLVHFDINEDGTYSWQAHLLPVKAARPKPVKL